MTRTETQSRKRPAPGTSPPPQQQSSDSPHLANPAQMSNEDFLAWGAGTGMPQQQQSGVYDLDGFEDMESQLNPGRTAGGPSNQLVRRSTEQQLAAGNRDPQFWSAGPPAPAWNDTDDYAEIEQRARAAKKDAQSKKPPKSIQPFIQKLWDLLQNNQDTDLIRWTANGDSFVVLDEDRFAREQLPTYFKHDKYPSFVRQLNMYGFHKRVGLTDNSMRASKTKAKIPSEYENPFFKRDRPILQWLITKPKQHSSSKSKGKKANGEEEEESGDEKESQPVPTSRREEGRQRKSLDLVNLPRTQLVQFQDEISQLKRSQQHINNMIARFQHENNQYIRRATVQHERHEQSINAILQFLATFYSQSQEGSNIANMFHGAIHSQQPQGNVQEMGDMEESMSPSDNNTVARVRRQPLLLQAPPANLQKSATPEETPRPPSKQQRVTPANKEKSETPAAATRPQQAPSPAVKRDSNSPPKIPVMDNSGQDNSTTRPQTSNTPSNNDMLAVINNMNANTPGGAPDVDLNLALRNYENMNNGPLTPEQRDTMLSMLANTSGLSPQTSNALLSTTGANMGGPQAALSQWGANKEQIDMLQRMQQEQDSKVQDLAGRLQPLSPSGSIPGFEQAYNNNADVNFDNWVNSDLFNSDGASGPDGTDWNLDGNFSLNDGDDYFGATTAGAADGAGAGSSNSAGAGAGFDDFGAQGQGGTDLFGEDGTEGAPDETAAYAEDPGESGRVLGSVPNSEGARTPNTAAEGEEEGGGRRRKRRRV